MGKNYRHTICIKLYVYMRGRNCKAYTRRGFT